MLDLVEVVGLLPHASNATVLARDGEGGYWVYKPTRGEQPLWDFPHGTLASREILAYEVSEALGLGIVPRTVAARGPLGFGSAQVFLNEDFDFDPRPLFAPHIDDRLWPFAVLDIVTNNADRKVGHLLHDQDSDSLWAIDNGLTFHQEEKLRTVLWGFAGRRIPEGLLVGVDLLCDHLSAGLRSRVAALLSGAEADALVRRAEGLRADPVHPQPPEDRPAVPWPMW